MRRTWIFTAMGVMLATGTYHAGLYGGETASTDDASVDAPVVSAGQLPVAVWFLDAKEAFKHADERDGLVLIRSGQDTSPETAGFFGSSGPKHPLLAEAAASLFVPLYVSRGGRDSDGILSMGGLSDPGGGSALGFVSAKHEQVRSPISASAGVGALATAMLDALDKAHRHAPDYLTLLAEEFTGREDGKERATLSMHCFWEGEAALGQIPGVVGTMPGFIGKLEVVEVEFDSTRLAFETLVDKAMSKDCAAHLFTRNDRQQSISEKKGWSAARSNEPIRNDREPKYYLAQTLWKFVPMTELQSMRVNALISKERDPKHLLSPGQLALWESINLHPTEKWKKVVNTEDMTGAWNQAMKRCSELERR